MILGSLPALVADRGERTRPGSAAPGRTRHRQVDGLGLSANLAQGIDRCEDVLADITLARLYVQAGEPDALRLAASAISVMAPLRSGIARAGLGPLATELETRPRSDLRELARRARQLATSPA
jgi:hypothetical protein